MCFRNVSLIFSKQEKNSKKKKKKKKKNENVICAVLKDVLSINGPAISEIVGAYQQCQIHVHLFTQLLDISADLFQINSKCFLGVYM